MYYLNTYCYYTNTVITYFKAYFRQFNIVLDRYYYPQY